MANRHFGKLSDVWKHAALAEVLEREPPARYAETHAGSGAYPIVHDGERQFGILRFLHVAGGSEVLARCEVAQADGMAAVAAWLDRDAGTPGLVHIDPFDPDARAAGGYSAFDLAARVASSGTALVYWYGYDQPSEQAWAYTRLAAETRAPLWCGDVMVTGTSRIVGDLGRATTPGTGFGVILANLQAGTVGACTALGNALADAYAGALLPMAAEAISSSQHNPILASPQLYDRDVRALNEKDLPVAEGTVSNSFGAVSGHDVVHRARLRVAR